MSLSTPVKMEMLKSQQKKQDKTDEVSIGYSLVWAISVSVVGGVFVTIFKKKKPKQEM